MEEEIFFLGKGSSDVDTCVSSSSLLCLASELNVTGVFAIEGSRVVLRCSVFPLSLFITPSTKVSFSLKTGWNAAGEEMPGEDQSTPKATNIQHGEVLVMALRRYWWKWWSIFIKTNVFFRIFIYEMSIVLSKVCPSSVTEQPTHS